MKQKNIKKPSKTEWKRLAKLKDKNIDFSDLPELGRSFFSKAVLRLPERKRIISLRLDQDLLEWLRKQGRGYQTKINAILRMYMEAHVR